MTHDFKAALDSFKLLYPDEQRSDPEGMKLYYSMVAALELAIKAQDDNSFAKDALLRGIGAQSSEYKHQALCEALEYLKNPPQPPQSQEEKQL